MSKLNPGDLIRIFDKTLEVCELETHIEPEKTICSICEARFFCSRDYASLRNACAKNECVSCADLIGQYGYFKIKV